MKTFKRIYIEITNCCNLTCSFCPPSKREQKFMDLEAFRRVLDKLKGHGQYIYLHIKGEPMLHPQFFDILKVCDDYDVKVNLTTNGTLIQGSIEALIDQKSLRQVSISLQSQENTEDVEAFKVYMAEVLNLVAKGSSLSDVIFELRLWNYEEMINGYRSGKNQVALDMIMDSLDVPIDTIESIGQGKGIKLKPQVYLSKSLAFQWPDMSLDIIGRQGTCYGLRQQVGILVNGDVVPCCLDHEGDVVLGNIFESDFESIVTSNRASTMVDGFEQRKIVEPLCMRCGYRQRFGN